LAVLVLTKTVKMNKQNQHRPRLNDEEYKLIQEYRGIIEASEEMQLNVKDVKHGWLKNKHASVFFKNPHFQIEQFDPDKINWDKILRGLNLSVINHTNKIISGCIFDRLVFTDTHVAMNPNPDGYSQYGGKWDEEELQYRTEQIIHKVVKNRKSPILFIDDLGDLMDGWNGETLRKGHSLPQNMDNQKAFDIALEFKITLIGNLSRFYKKVYVNNICNDNHSGAFGYMVNEAAKKVLKYIAKNVRVFNHRKFINHYRIKDNIFIISHGKDQGEMKFGFKPHLDKPGMEKIDNYIDRHYLLQKGVRIEFSKGDSHQLLFDSATSDRFDYFNYMALSPASNYIQTNYKIGKSGASFFNYRDTFNYIVEHFFFKWNKE